MPVLNPEQALEQLERDYKAYLNSPADHRGELAVPLQRAIARGEIEMGNLQRDAETDVEKRRLHNRLMVTVELAKGSMPQV